MKWSKRQSAHLMSIEQVVYTFGFCLLHLLFGGRDCCQTEIRLVAMPRNYIERGNFQYKKLFKKKLSLYKMLSGGCLDFYEGKLVSLEDYYILYR